MEQLTSAFRPGVGVCVCEIAELHVASLTNTHSWSLGVLGVLGVLGRDDPLACGSTEDNLRQFAGPQIPQNGQKLMLLLMVVYMTLWDEVKEILWRRRWRQDGLSVFTACMFFVCRWVWCAGNSLLPSCLKRASPCTGLLLKSRCLELTSDSRS